MALLRLPEVMRLSGYSRSTLYALIAQGLYPKPVKISERAVAWPSHEVESMIGALVSRRPTLDRRQLVAQLEASRLTALSTPNAAQGE